MTSWRECCTVLALLLAGCMGSPAEEGLLDGAEPGARPVAAALPEMPLERWSAAPAGCEGQLVGEDLRFAHTAGAPELVAVLHSSVDQVLCVDSLAAIRADLELPTRGPATGLGPRYTVGSGTFDPMRRSVTSADPSPQPSVEGSEQAQGDPSPQPSSPTNMDRGDDSAQGDPSPQPSSPTDSSDGTSASAG